MRGKSDNLGESRGPPGSMDTQAPPALTAFEAQFPAPTGSVGESLAAPRGQADAEPRPFPTIPGYEIQAELGRGGMGVVYRARHLRLNRVVALKMILAGGHASVAQISRFLREAESVAQMQHPNIVQLFESGQHDGLPYFTLEFVAGGSLSHNLAGAPLAAKAAARLVEQLAHGVAYAHHHGLVHRDLKPANVLLASSGSETPDPAAPPENSCPTPMDCIPKIADFGLAKHLESVSGLTATGAIVGTPSYMAPEQARVREDRQAGAASSTAVAEPSSEKAVAYSAGDLSIVGPAADIYALGAILYECLAGRPPFRGPTAMDTMMQVVSNEPVSPRQLQPRVPRDLETICLKCLQKETHKRYASAAELAEELHRFQEGQPIRARPVSAMEKMWRWCRRNPIVAGLSAALVLAVLGGLAAVSVLWLRAEENASQARLAREEVTNKLWDTYLAQAQAERWSGRAGRRFLSLDALAKAAQIRPDPRLRHEAIACLALPDLHVNQVRKMEPPLKGANGIIDRQMRRYARHDADGNIEVRQLADDALVAKFPSPGWPVQWALQFSPDDRYLAARYRDALTGPLHIWELQTGKEATQSLRPMHAGAVAFSPDSRLVAVGEADSSLRIYDLATGAQVHHWQKTPDVYSIAWHPNGTTLAISILNNQFVHIRDINGAGKVEASLKHPSMVRGLAWHPDGHLLATACADTQVYLWNPRQSPAPVKVMPGHHGAVTAVSFDPSGQFLASTSWDATTRLWDLFEARLLVTAQGGFTHFSRDGRMLAFTNSTYEVGVWKVNYAEESRNWQRRAPLMDLHSEVPLAVWAIEGRVFLADLDGKQAPVALPIPCWDARFLPAWQGLVTFGPQGVHHWPLQAVGDAVGGDAVGGEKTVEVGPGRLLHRAKHHPLHHGVVSRDGKKILFREGGDSVFLDLAEPQLQKVLTPHEGVNEVALSGDGRLAASATWHKYGVKIWDTGTGACLRELPIQWSASIGFSIDDRWLVTGTGGEYRFWKTDSWESAFQIERFRAFDLPGPIAFSPNGRVVALSQSRHVTHVVELATGKLLAILESDDSQQITGLLFGPDPGKLFEVRGNHTRIWDLRRLREQLHAIGLDWELPGFPPAPAGEKVRVMMKEGV